MNPETESTGAVPEAGPEAGPGPDPGGAAPPMQAWTRLHPLSPLIRFSRAVVVLLVVTLPRTLFTNEVSGLWIEAVVVVLGVVAAVVYWWTTRWRVYGGELQIETGLLRRQSIRVPLARTQAIDVVAPLLARMSGLAEVASRSPVAGRGTADWPTCPETKPGRCVPGCSRWPTAEATTSRWRPSVGCWRSTTDG